MVYPKQGNTNSVKQSSKLVQVSTYHHFLYHLNQLININLRKTTKTNNRLFALFLVTLVWPSLLHYIKVVFMFINSFLHTKIITLIYVCILYIIPLRYKMIVWQYKLMSYSFQLTDRFIHYNFVYLSVCNSWRSFM